MPENDNIERKKGEKPSDIEKSQKIGLWLIGSGSIVGVTALTAIALGFRGVEQIPQWVSFLTDNMLTLLLLVVVVVQAYIYCRQWEVMKTQERVLEKQASTFESQVTAMQGQLTAMQDGLAQNERTVAAAEQSVEIARQSFYVS